MYFIDLNVIIAFTMQHNCFVLVCVVFPCFRSIMGKLETNVLYSILDEIVFKISASEESSVGR